MDKALFRGKRMDNNQWVYGDIIHSAGTKQIFIREQGDVAKESGKIYGKTLLRLFVFEVYPETVGQWSDETDINNKKIFKGDIVKYTHDWDVFGEYDVVTVVEFNCGGFEPMSLANGGAFYSCGDRKYEVLGNIYDNPELLE